MGSPPARPVLLYDGDCGFCRWSADLGRRLTGDRVDYLGSAGARRLYPEIPEGEFARAVVFIRPDGWATTAAEAAFGALAEAPGWGWVLRLYQALTPFAWASEAVYALVTRHRGFLSKLTRPLR